MDAILPGSIDETVYFRLRDSITGLAKTGLAFDSAGVICSYTRNRAEAVQIPLVTLASASASHTDGGFVEVSDTLAKGDYRLDLPDAVLIAGSRTVLISIEFDGIIEETKEVHLDGVFFITFTPVAVTVSAGVVTDNAITVHQHEAFGPFLFTITDDNGDAVDLSASDLEFRVWEPDVPGTVLWTIDSSGTSNGTITVGGASNNQVTVSDNDDNTGTGGIFRYVLWDTTGDKVRARGTLNIVEEADSSG